MFVSAAEGVTKLVRARCADLGMAATGESGAPGPGFISRPRHAVSCHAARGHLTRGAGCDNCPDSTHERSTASTHRYRGAALPPGKVGGVSPSRSRRKTIEVSRSRRMLMVSL